MAPYQGANLAARQVIPTDMPLPEGFDPIPFMLELPALSANQIPPGADRTMTTDGPDQIWYLVVAITCIAVPGLFLIMRVYTKLAIVRSFEIADYFIFLSFPLIIVEVVVGYFMISHGAGVHQWQVTFRQLFEQLYWMNTGEIIYCPLSFLVKTSILLQYIRLFAPDRHVNKFMWFASWATIAGCGVFYSVFMFWTMYYCKPRQMIWNKFTPGGTCHDHGPIVISQGSFNMASDIIILLLPTHSLWQLSVPFARKMVITLLFATGLLACAASAMRILFTVKIAPIISMSDVSHNGLFIGLWTEAEVALSFIVACALCIPRLIQAKGQKLKTAMSYASSPFSSIRGTVSNTVRSASPKSTLQSQSGRSTQATLRDSQQMSSAATPHHTTQTERRSVQPDSSRMGVMEEEHDVYMFPSQGSSNYSRSIESKSISEDDSCHVAPLALSPRSSAAASKHLSDRSAQWLISEGMTAEQLRRELNTLQQFDFDAQRDSAVSQSRGRDVSAQV